MCCQFWNLTAKSSLNPRQSSVMWPGNLVSIRQTGITRVYLETIIHLVLLLLSLCYCLDCFFVFLQSVLCVRTFWTVSIFVWFFIIYSTSWWFLFIPSKKKFNNKTMTCDHLLTSSRASRQLHVYKLSFESCLVPWILSVSFVINISLCLIQPPLWHGLDKYLLEWLL